SERSRSTARARRKRDVHGGGSLAIDVVFATRVRPVKRKTSDASRGCDTRYAQAMGDDLGIRIARNVKQLRQTRGFTQAQLAKIPGVPRATWTNLESGGANPTVSVLRRAAGALQVSIEELLSEPRAECEMYPRGTLPMRTQGQALVRELLPHAIPGME